MNVITLNTDVNSIDFDYLEWTQTNPTQEEFIAVWQQFSEYERSLILADFERWLATNS
ncbi:MAG: hypothetical protein ACM37W_00505 [Actinomycetota bacterium]